MSVESPTPEQLAKLPKWAREHVSNCERGANDATKLLKDYMDSTSPSLIYTRSGLRDKHYIQDDRVSFQLKNGEVTVALKDDVLECHADYGWGRLIMLPRSSNVVHLEIIQDKR